MPAFASAFSPSLVQLHSSEYRNPGQLFAADPLVGFSRRALMIPKLTSVSRTVGVSNGHPRLDDGRVLEDVRGQLSDDVLGVLVHTAEQRRADPVLVARRACRPRVGGATHKMKDL